MLSAERYEKIKAYMYENKYANINELAVLFDASVPTIRRCLKQLEKENIVESVRGGAVLHSSDKTIFEQPYQVKKQQNADEKSRIAAEACKYIQSNSSIFLDSSTTVYGMIPFMQGFKSLSICTNDVTVAGTLTSKYNYTVMVVGGILRSGYYTLTGNFAEKMMCQFHMDCAFMGSDTISETGNFMITNAEEMGIKRAAFQNSSKRIMLCDHSKFDRDAFVNLWDFEQVDMVITGRELEDERYDFYTELGLKIVRV